MSVWDTLRGLPGTTQRLVLRRLLRKNPWTFLRCCLYPEREFEPFHRSWLELVQREPRALILAPRGFFKTTTVTVGLAAHRAFFNPDGAWLVVSRTARQAELILAELRQVLEREETSWLNGGPVVARATREALRFSARRRPRKEPTLATAGSGQALVGRHHDGIVADDLVSPQSAFTQRTRDSLEHWFTNALAPTLLPGGTLHLVGTRHHPLDLYGRALKLGIPTNEDSRASILDDGTALFPSRWPLERLEGRRRELGPVAFALQYQNDTGPAAGTFFNPEHLRRPAGEPPPTPFRVLAVDLALGGDDYVAAVVLGIAADGDWYALEARRARLDFHSQLRLIAELTRRFRVSLVGVEQVAYQTAAVQELRRRERLPVVGLRPRGGKLLRANVLAAYFAAGRLWLPPESGPLEDELLAFPEGRHDDLVDALGYACELAAGRGVERPPVLGEQFGLDEDDHLARSLGLS